MCGIAGFFSKNNGRANSELRFMVNKMVDALQHRGPDDSGVWVDAEVGVALGHRRLSILDLSPEGHQPMHSACGRYVVAFNGEIYNYREIREELEKNFQGTKLTWRGHSDTEVMLEAFRQWGVVAAVKRFNGMFAFALWDRTERVLYLVRDRIGEKPLYYGWMERTLFFGSELKALRAHPDFNCEINRDALALYLRHNYIPAPYSIYKGIYKLLPGTILTISPSKDASPNAIPYWSAREVAEQGTSEPFTGSTEDAIARLDSLLRDAVKLRMEADVPLGAFLSGGVDSSTVVALMQAQSSQKVKTFTIGFYEAGYNEAKHAQEVARHLGTDHTELYVTSKEAMAVIPRLLSFYDEPFSDSSQIPTFLVSEMTRRHVTVALSGDGGDELFCGYIRYQTALSIWKKIAWLPDAGRKSIAYLLKTIPIGVLDKLFFGIIPIIKKHGRPGAAGDKLRKLADILAIESPDCLYLELVSHWKDPSSLVFGSNEPMTVFTDPSRNAALADFTQRMMFMDTVSYLPDDILCKVDRASMGVSLEARVPFLDHRVVELAWRLPLSMKIRNGESKWLLSQVLHKYVPREMIERPKMGFGVPIGEWLRNPLRDWAEELLAEKRLLNDGFFNPVPIREKWLEHLSGKRNWQYYLWDILMFQAWLAKEVAFGKSLGSW